MDLPTSVREGVEEVLGTLGHGSLSTVRSVGGGCIHRGTRIDSTSGYSLFLKWNPDASRIVFEDEADGLGALASASTLRVPRVLGVGGGSGEPAWLAMEFIEAGRSTREYSNRLGAGLAALHDSGDGPPGWARDNWIGSLAQPNGVSDSWSRFWVERRLRPQLHMAREAGQLNAREMDDLLSLLEGGILDASDVGLLHGDLWSGNVFSDTAGRPVLIDPAVYRGAPEVDLAMTELFGGFHSEMYEAYEQVRPIADGYDAYLRDVYQLYYLLVHVNLFGGSYTAAATTSARRALAELA